MSVRRVTDQVLRVLSSSVRRQVPQLALLSFEGVLARRLYLTCCGLMPMRSGTLRDDPYLGNLGKGRHCP